MDVITWFKVDDNLAFHRKTVAAGNAAMGLWVRAGSWSAAHLTDGFVPDHMIAVLGSPAQKSKLVTAGLWIPVDGGCQFHGWNDDGRQPTAKSVREKREKAAARQSKHRNGTYAPTPSAREKNNLATTSSIKDNRTASTLRAVDNSTLFDEPQVDDARNDVTPALVTGGVTGVVTTAPTRPDPYLREEHSLAPLAEVEPLPRDTFAEFWDAYPRRQDKRAAEKAWKAAVKRSADPDKVIAAAHAYARQQVGNERRFIKLPATWLNAGAYDNDLEQPSMQLVVNGYQTYRNPADPSVWDEPLLPPNATEER